MTAKAEPLLRQRRRPRDIREDARPKIEAHNQDGVLVAAAEHLIQWVNEPSLQSVRHRRHESA